MKVTVAQINTTPCDFVGNYSRIHAACHKANEQNTDLIVFPELTICGYLIRDMIHQDGFVDKNLRMLGEITNASKDWDFHIVVGYVDHNRSGSGKPFRNMAAVIHKGIVVATYQKQLLPFYDVFDEGRYFEAGNDLCVIDIHGFRCGLAICEDIWNCKGQDDYNHHNNPIHRYRKVGVDTIISLNSSPYNQGKPLLRKKMLKNICENHGIRNLIYVNQYGAQDELVFDGNSMVVRNGSIVQTIPIPLLPKKLDEVDLMTVDLNSGTYIETRQTNCDETLAMTLLGLHDYVKKIGVEKVVVGSSGGIDSAVVIALSSMAFGGENVHAIKMPSKWSSDHSVTDAAKLHENFGVNDYTVKINHEPWLNEMNDQLGLNPTAGGYIKVADENIQARQRGQVVMHFSNATGALPLTTGNKTELALGYCTLYGDMNGGFNPIGDLYKREIYNIAGFINSYYKKEMIPNNIIYKAPSAELAPGQTDEASLLPYSILDPIIKFYIENYVSSWDVYKKEVNNFLSSGNHLFNSESVRMWIADDNNKETYEGMIRRVDMMEFKRRQAAPCTRVTKKAFGTGRRQPIVKKSWQ